MPARNDEQTIHTLDVQRSVDVRAPIRTVFESLLDELGPESEMPDGAPFPMVFEPWPGGRWFRDLGDNAGHLWGHVQVIKPPTLIEITGPLFMSYAAASHVQWRLTEEGDVTHLTVTHKAIGMIPEDHRTGVIEGWDFSLSRVREIAERQTSGRANR